MPRKSPTPCKCGKRVVERGKCADCLSKSRRQIDRVRGNSAQRGYGGEHRDRFRLGVMQRDRWMCRLCGDPAVQADHYPLTRRELVAKGLDPNDPQHGRALCTPCHSRHTAKTGLGTYRRAR